MLTEDLRRHRPWSTPQREIRKQEEGQSLYPVILPLYQGETATHIEE
jgi:hypothetical protein